ncbi:MAG: carboxypeptidase-like regulatory domain-containing protein [Candidatus Sulfotelmatobacter sp.]
MFINYLTAVCIFLVLASSALVNAGPVGFLEGHLRIVSPKPVELAEASPQKFTPQSYAEYPLIIRTRDGKKEIKRVTADKNGDYRIELPPGDYVLDVQGRAPGHVRAKPQPFTVASNHTVRVDMDIDTGIR